MRVKAPWLQAALLLCASSLLPACATGDGEGAADGTVTIKACDKDNASYSLRPSVFAALPADTLLELRMQRGGDLYEHSDGLTLLVRDPKVVRDTLLGQPITLGPSDNPVEATFYMNDTCEVKFDQDTVDRLPAVLKGVGGSVTFQKIYVPKDDRGNKTTEATFNLMFSDVPPAQNDRHAELMGRIKVDYSRDNPTEHFQ